MIEINKIKKIVIKVGSSLIANYKTSLIKQAWVDSFIDKNIKLILIKKLLKKKKLKYHKCC